MSFFTIFALLLPFFTLTLATRAEAQIETKEPWAVVEFADKSPRPVKDLGKLAAESVSGELAKLNRYDIQPTETVERKMVELGYQAPVTDVDQLMRLGQNIPVVTIVSGEIVNSRVLAVNGGKVGQVKMRVIVRDVASGLPINGAALLGESSVRAGDVADETLIQDAIAAGAFKVVGEIARNTLPKATVLNTLDKTALINQGSRSGFVRGQQVIVLRGREQVASATVAEVEPGSAFVTISRQRRGVQPGDRVQVIFSVPEIKTEFGKGSEVGTVVSRKTGSSSSMVSLMLVLGVIGFLFFSKNSSNNKVVADLAAEALVLPDDRPAVRLSWRPDAFVKGNVNRYLWQIWRSDTPEAPVMVQDGQFADVVDDGNALGVVNWYQFETSSNVPGCPALPGATTGTRKAVVPGTPYVYSIELVYRISALDDPNFGGGESNGGGTGGGTGGGGTGGGGRGLFSRSLADYLEPETPSYGAEPVVAMMQDSGTDYCYFISQRTTSKGTATPFNRPTLRSPDNGVTISTPPVFRFESVRLAGSSVAVEYCVQLSPSITFPAGQTQTVLRFVDNNSTGTMATPAVPQALTAFPNSRELFWRIGARNVADVPGPVPDNGERYIFSAPLKFARPVQPPGP